MPTPPSRTAADIQRERAALRAQYAELYDWLTEALFKADPIGINFGDNTDEYEPEVGSILPRLSACSNAQEVLAMMHEEFCRWFDPQLAGPAARYREVAAELWERFQATHG